MRRRVFLRQGAYLAGAAWSLSIAGRAIAASSAEWTAAEFHAARRFVERGPQRIAYVERGSGPVALFLHGYPLNGFHWRGSMARLASLRRCIAPDLMGLGYSDVPADTDLSPASQTAMLFAFLDRLGIDQVDIVANDSATGIAQLMTAAHPDRVRSLLLTNGDVHTNSPPEALLPFLEMAKRGEAVGWYEHHLNDNAWARHGGIGDAYHDPDKALTHEVIETYFRPLVASDKRRQQGQTYGTAMFPNPLPAIEPRLRTFPRPVRIVWARNNKLFGDQWAHWLDQTFPQSRGIRFVDQAQLFFPEEQPALIASEAKRLWTA